MTRSMRVMFLALIAAMLAAVITLRAKNDALSRELPKQETSRRPFSPGEIVTEPPFCPSGVEGLLELPEFAQGRRPLDFARGNRGEPREPRVARLIRVAP